MFYGLKVRKSNLATDTIVQAVGLTSGKARFNKDKDDYSFSNRFSKLNLLQILSDYFGVVCYGKSNEVEVIKPQSQTTSEAVSYTHLDVYKRQHY